MQYTTLGRTGIRVSRLCLGTVQFGLQLDEQASHRVMDRAFELGINFIDTADRYEMGVTERFVGSWLEGKRHQVVLATKVRGRMGPGPNDTGLSRVHIIQAVEASLRRLRTDYIDLYQMHAPDDLTPVETTLRALEDLVRQGKVRAIGCSNYAAWELCKALWVSDVRNLARFESVQPRYNLLARDVEAELVPLCLSEQVSIIPYNPIAGGMLSGKYQWGQPPAEGTRFQVRSDLYQTRYWYESNFQVVERLKPIAAESGRSLVQYALAWVLANPAVASAIAGATSTAQVEENVAALERPLTADEYRAGCEASIGALAGPSTGPRQD
ncbi:MAG: aldo/keto reductase [Bacteroidetes bacterium]|nr:aldo/keto reductase [Bacteroidota bacterium]MCL5025647.1 aldo/keto reductase [Chloroflexota bacterium]